eukprot:c7894_g1_i1.p1 GENE.c7894_g1_i1~~c7894_g1_i1.p1  ORF type:complete len:467 (-),score=116.35 c7894_g1_i1:135-1535(-)
MREPEVEQLKIELSLAKDKIAKMTQDHDLTFREAAMRLDSLNESHIANESKLRQRVRELEHELEGKDAQLKLLKKSVDESECSRRKLHNTIMELKGNIRVFCRIRPVLSSDREKHGEAVLADRIFNLPSSTADDLTQSLEVSVSDQRDRGVGLKQHLFSFDRIFDQSASQEKVFEEISQLIQSALDGYRVCIFAYGQTGSGKTFTMEGDSRVPNGEGMIPRAMQQIFASVASMAEKDWKYELSASFVEIYNESIRDLLRSGSTDSTKHEIKRSADGQIFISDVTIAPLANEGQALACLSRASTHRAIGETKMNGRSSRSHSLFTLFIRGTHASTGETVEGKLNLIDLAGSERLSTSGALSSSQLTKETLHINKSLSGLADVVSALASGDKHVPYRNTKLTSILQDSLGGNSKMLMFVNCSPLSVDAKETVCSLRFASKVNSCYLGPVKRQHKVAGTQSEPDHMEDE